MIAEGCIMLRACHKDTCTTGIATQRPHLRAKFAGTPEGVAAYFIFVAQEVRGLLASVGLRSLDDAIGRVDLLRQRAVGDVRADSARLAPLLRAAADPSAPLRYRSGLPLQRPRSELGDRLLADAYRGMWEGEELRLSYPIGNGDRSIGAALGGALALEFGEEAPRGRAHLSFDGSAGQSFGAFLTAGLTLELRGEANDYVGKAMGGGTIIVRPPADDASLVPDADPRRAHRPALAGNTCLYGATGGELYVSGIVGERFGIRNSGATSVVEGAGDHACEYMTGGTVVILGRVGYNLGAGMTGGSCYVWDPDGTLVGRVNTSLVDFERPDQPHADELRRLVARHAELTGSPRAAHLLGGWEDTSHEFWYVAPLDKVSRMRSQAAAGVGANV
jgi:glutamate synthase (ferredoxin)